MLVSCIPIISRFLPLLGIHSLTQSTDKEFKERYISRGTKKYIIDLYNIQRMGENTVPKEAFGSEVRGANDTGRHSV